jgi:hypothetical protein
MTRRDHTTQVALVALVARLLAFPTTVRAHEKWLYDATLYPTRWEQAFQFPSIVGVEEDQCLWERDVLGHDQGVRPEQPWRRPT